MCYVTREEAEGSGSADAPRGRPEQRASFVAGTVDHLLAHGVTRLSLRPLAAALGTSDRMLLYYFGTRDGLLVAALAELGRRLEEQLAAALPADPVPAPELVDLLWRASDLPGAEPYLRLYLEVSALAARGEEPYRTAAGSIADGWIGWFAARLDTEGSARDAAAGVLAALDGLLLTRYAVSRDVAATAAAWLTAGLAAVQATGSP